jgi:hypothetical protein
MPDRRYSDDEVSEIIARASETEQDSRTRLQPAEGLTLAELQKIGAEAGIAPALIAQAARSLDEPRPPAPPVFLGLPLGAARTVRLERRMTDAEWESLVVALRETFNARGVIRTEGSFRSWSNGNLQCLVEPDGEGQRVRFRTVRGNARPMMFMGLGMMGVSAVGAISTMLVNSISFGDFAQMLTIALTGAGVFAIGALPLPRWAKLRQRQMDELAEKLSAPSP